MEEILKQLLLQRAQQTLAQAAQEDAAFQQQLRQTKVFRSQASLQRAGAVDGPNLHRGPNTVNRGGTPSGMSPDEFAGAVADHNGRVLPSFVYGMTDQDFIEGMTQVFPRMRSQDTDDRVEHVLGSVFPPGVIPEPGQAEIATYTGREVPVAPAPIRNPIPGSPDHPTERAYGAFDEKVRRTGYEPSDFNNLSHREAAALIAGQLEARRMAQLGEWDPSYAMGAGI